MRTLLVAGYLSIDTITTPAGREEGVPGGAALYAALAAARLARGTDLRVALLAAVGEDYPQDWLTALSGLGVGVERVERRAGPTRRARLEHDNEGGRRSGHYAQAQFWERTAALTPPVDDLSGASGIVAGPMPVAVLSALVDRATCPVIADTSEAVASREGQALTALLPRLGVFAPSREETRVLLPGLDDDAALAALAAAGPRIVQKRGADGLAACEGPGAPILRLTAPEVSAVVDPTGAGDSLVGALGAALVLGQDFPAALAAALTTAALTVSALGPGGLGLSWCAPSGREARLSA